MNAEALYCFGSNFSGQLGIGATVRNVPSYCPYPFGRISESESSIDSKDIQDVQCGAQFTVTLATDGQLSICGILNGAAMPILTPVEITYPMRCLQISCGRKHILALLDGAYVASWGTGYFGQLGHGDDSSWDSPRLISALDPNTTGIKVTQIVCGGSHSGALTEQGRVFMWGLNRNGQCGVTSVRSDSVMEPKLVDMSGLEGRAAASLVCGRNHSAMVTAEGRVYSWGAASFGRLGHLDAKKKQSVPLEISFFRTIPVHSIAAGDFHMLALGHDCSVYSWGYGAEGQCGHGNTFHLRTPKRIEFFDSLSVVRLGCGASWSLAINKAGDLYAWGYSDDGWTGLIPKKRMAFVEPEPSVRAEMMGVGHTQSFDSRHNVLIPKRVKLLSNRCVDQVRCGSAHTIVFTSRRVRDSSAGLCVSAFDDGDSGSEDDVQTRLCGSFCSIDIPVSNKSPRSPLGTRTSSLDSMVKNGNGDPSASKLIAGTTNVLYSQDPAQMTESIISWCRHKKIAELSYALARGADITVRDEYGNSPLMVACQNGHSSVVHLLVEHGADLCASNHKGNTPLHFCFAYGFEDLGKYLITQGADEFAVNEDGLTCYEGLSLAELENNF